VTRLLSTLTALLIALHVRCLLKAWIPNRKVVHDTEILESSAGAAALAACPSSRGPSLSGAVDDTGGETTTTGAGKERHTPEAALNGDVLAKSRRPRSKAAGTVDSRRRRTTAATASARTAHVTKAEGHA